MATLPSTHCCRTYSSSSSASYSSVHRSLQRVAVSPSPQRFVSAKVSLQSQSVSHQNVVSMQDVAPAVKPVENETAFKKLKDGLLSATSGSVEESKDASGFIFEESESTVSITVVGAKNDFGKTEDDLKSLQSVGQIIGEVLRPLDYEHYSESGSGTHPPFTLKSPIFLKAGKNEIALLTMTVGLQSYQTLFHEGECFLHIVSLLNGNLDDANGETLVLGVLQTLTCLLASNDTSKPELCRSP